MKDKPYGQYRQDKAQVFSYPTNHLKEKLDISTSLAGKHLQEMRHRFLIENAEALKEAQEEQRMLREKRIKRLTAIKLRRLGKYRPNP